MEFYLYIEFLYGYSKLNFEISIIRQKYRHLFLEYSFISVMSTIRLR